MQLLNFVAATATPLVALVNPGATYIGHDHHAIQRQVNNGYLKQRGQVAVANIPKLVAPRHASLTDQHGAAKAPLVLRRLRSFAQWSDNWDGDGAPAPKKANIESATLVLGFLQSRLGSTPNVSLNADGDPMFTFIEGLFEIALTVTTDSEISYIVANDANEQAGSVYFNKHELPEEIVQAILALKPTLDQ